MLVRFGSIAVVVGSANTWRRNCLVLGSFAFRGDLDLLSKVDEIHEGFHPAAKKRNSEIRKSPLRYELQDLCLIGGWCNLINFSVLHIHFEGKCVEILTFKLTTVEKFL